MICVSSNKKAAIYASFYYIFSFSQKFKILGQERSHQTPIFPFFYMHPTCSWRFSVKPTILKFSHIKCLPVRPFCEYLLYWLKKLLASFFRAGNCSPNILHCLSDVNSSVQKPSLNICFTCSTFSLFLVECFGEPSISNCCWLVEY